MITRFDGKYESVLRMMFLVAIRVRRYSALALSGSIVSFTAAGIWISGAAETPHADPIAFENIAARSGVDFVLRNSATPARRQIETMVSGVAIFDYNSDGKPDIYFVNGARQPQLDKPDSSYYNRLYRNDGEGRFTDVTLAAGVRGDGFATGVAAGDFDNDGWQDLFIAGVNRNILYRNRGNGGRSRSATRFAHPRAR